MTTPSPAQLLNTRTIACSNDQSMLEDDKNNFYMQVINYHDCCAKIHWEKEGLSERNGALLTQFITVASIF